MTQSNARPTYDPKLFIGIEIEGIHKGLRTLFVQGSVASNIIADAVLKHECDQIYFGAKYKVLNDRFPSYVPIITVSNTAKAFERKLITVELEWDVINLWKFDLPKSKNIELVLPVLSQDLVSLVWNTVEDEEIRDRIHLKFFSEKEILIIPLSRVILTRLSDYALLNDTEL